MKTEHLLVYVLCVQPAVEIISFRLAELRGLARWRSRFEIIGLDENLIDGVTESIGMLVVQVERFSRVEATALYLVPFISICIFQSVRITFFLSFENEAPTFYINNVQFLLMIKAC